MDIKEIKMGNFLQYHRQLIKVERVDLRNQVLYTDYDSCSFNLYEVKPVILSQYLKLSLLKQNYDLYRDDEELTNAILSIQFRVSDHLHIIQNYFNERFDRVLDIDTTCFCIIQQSLTD